MLALLALAGLAADLQEGAAAESGLKAVLLSAPQATDERLHRLQTEGNNAVVLNLSAVDGTLETAAANARTSGSA